MTRSDIRLVTSCCRWRPRACAVASATPTSSRGWAETSLLSCRSQFDRMADVTSLATRLIDTVGAPYQLDGHQVMVGTSIGIAIAPSDGTAAGPAYEERGSGALSLQGRRRKRVSIFRSANGRSHAGAPRSRARSAHGGGKLRVHAQLSAHRQYQDRKDQCLRGAYSLASRRTRLGAACAISYRSRKKRALSCRLENGCCVEPAPTPPNGRMKSRCRSTCRRPN